MISRHMKTCHYAAWTALVALAVVASMHTDSNAGRAVRPISATPAAGADNAPTLANRTLVPKAVRLVIGFRPTATT